jgi:hypothetical protein
MTPFLIITANIFLGSLGVIFLVHYLKEHTCPFCGRQGKKIGVEKSERRLVRQNLVLTMIRTVTKCYRCWSCHRDWQKSFEEESNYDPDESDDWDD